MQHPLRILFVGDESTRTQALAEVLRANAAEVEHVGSNTPLDRTLDADLFVIDGDLARCEELHESGVTLPFVLMAEADFETSRRAYQLGALNVIGRFEPSRLGQAVTAIASDPCPAYPNSERRHAERYVANDFTVRRAISDLRTFLETSRVAPAHVARVACAAAEILDNVQRHAYAPEEAGFFTLEARVSRSRVLVAVRDFGRGFDTQSVRLESVPAALPRKRKGATEATEATRGLTTVSRLCEGLALDSGRTGSHIELEFELSLSVVEHGGEQDCEASADDFHPLRLRSLVASLRQGDAWDQVPPALSLTLNRLLGRPRAQRETVVSR